MLLALLAAPIAFPGSAISQSGNEPMPFGHECSEDEGVLFCPTDTLQDRVETFDEVPLDVDVTLPEGTKKGEPLPTIVMLHGYGGSKDDFETDDPEPSDSTNFHYNNNFFAKQGYAVVNYTARGFGRSCGKDEGSAGTQECLDTSSYIHLADQRCEARDTQYLLGLLADQEITDPDAIGVTGISYGGGQSIELAYLKDRIRVDGDTGCLDTESVFTPSSSLRAESCVDDGDETASTEPQLDEPEDGPPTGQDGGPDGDETHGESGPEGVGEDDSAPPGLFGSGVVTGAQGDETSSEENESETEGLGDEQQGEPDGDGGEESSGDGEHDTDGGSTDSAPESDESDDCEPEDPQPEEDGDSSPNAPDEAKDQEAPSGPQGIEGVTGAQSEDETDGTQGGDEPAGNGEEAEEPEGEGQDAEGEDGFSPDEAGDEGERSEQRLSEQEAEACVDTKHVPEPEDDQTSESEEGPPGPLESELVTGAQSGGQTEGDRPTAEEDEDAQEKSNELEQQSVLDCDNGQELVPCAEPNDGFCPWTSPGGKDLSISAAFPRWPWSDLVSALLPNGRFLDTKTSDERESRDPIGIPIVSFIQGLFASGLASGTYCGTPPRPTSPVCPDFSADLVAYNTRVALGEPYEDEPLAEAIVNEIFKYHQGFGLPLPDGKPAPLLVQSGWTDQLFPVEQALRIYNQLRDEYDNANIALQFGDLGHQPASNKENSDKFFNDQGADFFDAKLMKKGKAPKRGSITAFTQTCPTDAPADGPFTAKSFKKLHPNSVRFSSDESQTVASANNDPYGELFDPIVADTEDDGACRDEEDNGEGPGEDGRAVYRLPPSDGFRMLGLPTVKAAIETNSATAQIDSRLWDVAPNRQQTLISRGAYRVGQDQTGRITFQLHGNGWCFEPGHVPKLELLGEDATYLRPTTMPRQDTTFPTPGQFPGVEGDQTPEDFLDGVKEFAGDFTELAGLSVGVSDLRLELPVGQGTGEGCDGPGFGGEPDGGGDSNDDDSDDDGDDSDDDDDSDDGGGDGGGNGQGTLGEQGSSRCLPRGLRAGRSGIGPLLLERTRPQILTGALEPIRRTPLAFRYCVEGGGRVYVAFSGPAPLGKSGIVISVTPEHKLRGIGRGSSRAELRRAFPEAEGLGSRRLTAELEGGGRVVFGLSRAGKVRYVAIVGAGMDENPRLLRSYLRSVRL